MGVALLTPIRQRRKPEESVLYRVLAGHLDTFLDRLEHADTRAANTAAGDASASMRRPIRT